MTDIPKKHLYLKDIATVNIYPKAYMNMLIKKLNTKTAILYTAHIYMFSLLFFNINMILSFDEDYTKLTPLFPEIAHFISESPPNIQITAFEQENSIMPLLKITEATSSETDKSDTIHTIAPARTKPKSNKNTLFTCNICNKYVTKYRSSLNRHKERHAQSKNYACTICDKKFPTRDDQKKHESCHTRNVKCTLCDKIFSHKKNLDTHMLRRHIKERSHACTIDDCDQKFVTQDDLNRHKKNIHDEERPFKCPVAGCNKAFGIKNTLNQHTKKVHKLQSSSLETY